MLFRKGIGLLVVLLGLAYSIQAQQQFAHPVTLLPSEVPVSFLQFIEKVERETGVRFFYDSNWIEYLSIDRAYTNLPLGRILDQVLEGSDITYTALSGYGIILVKDPSREIERQRLLAKAVAQRKKVEQLVIGNPADYHPDKKLVLRGLVTDEKTSSPVRNATITLLNAERGTTTNEQGAYELTLSPGSNLVSFSHANYSEEIIDLKIYTSGRLNIILEEVPIVLEEVIVTDQAIVNSTIGQVTLRVSEMKRTPVFLGEVDVVKQVQTQAGVTTVGELAAGFNVRGGSTDQNLVLYDGLPIFNTSHALGFFSAFNAEAINQVAFYKGGIPAEFGGRASSVLNVTSKEGNYNRWTGSGGIGFISTFLTVGGPIKKDTTSVIASVRATYSDWMLKLVNSDYTTLQNSSVQFYDGSFKLAHKFSAKSKLIFSGYFSRDRMRLTNDTLFQWNNLAVSARFDRAVSDKLFYSITMGMGGYRYTLNEADEREAFDLTYGIVYPSIRADFNYNDRNPKAFGFQATYYNFKPGTLRPSTPASLIPAISIADENAVEAGVYFSESFKLGNRINLDAGIRYALYARLGPGTVYDYEAGQPLEPQNVIDSAQYPAGSLIKFYHGPEPRLAARYSLNQFSSLKFGYNRLYQFVHLISNTAAVTPVDVWQSSNSFFRPQLADQVSAGYFRNLKENTYEVYGELFYKHIANILDFKDGASLILNNKLETALLPGKARSYGVELSATKLRGRLQGNMNYTFSRSFRQVNGNDEIEKINNGKFFPANFDQPHVVNLTWRYAISRRHYFSGNFTYHTGRPISLPAHIYYVDGIGISDFPERNTYRLPDYHRLDIAFIIEGNHKRKKLWDGTWVISAYNLYGRKNAYSVFFQQDQWGILKPYQLSVVGTVIPTINYTFKF
ncbi:MAG: carboxypeptidase-like regulatory domain-containing protein [Flammeovirgaceae bacterium]|nr:MAG: carboxypeptidase-like regulatory domain-containing protein [Flammeovirgaceae bacterium]